MYTFYDTNNMHFLLRYVYFLCFRFSHLSAIVYNLPRCLLNSMWSINVMSYFKIGSVIKKIYYDFSDIARSTQAYFSLFY